MSPTSENCLLESHQPPDESVEKAVADDVPSEENAQPEQQPYWVGCPNCLGTRCYAFAQCVPGLMKYGARVPGQHRITNDCPTTAPRTDDEDPN